MTYSESIKKVGKIWVDAEKVYLRRVWRNNPAKCCADIGNAVQTGNWTSSSICLAMIAAAAFLDITEDGKTIIRFCGGKENANPVIAVLIHRNIAGIQYTDPVFLDLDSGLWSGNDKAVAVASAMFCLA